MAHLMSQIILGRDTALPKDVFVNTWHYDTGAQADVNVVQGIDDAMGAFYGGVAPGNTSSLASKLGPQVSQAVNSSRHKIYNMAQPMPRVPVYDRPWTMPATNSSALPSEVAVCLSFEGVKQAGVPQSRRRGRVFLGPMADSGSVIDSTNGRVAAGFPDFIVNCAKQLHSDLLALGVTWSVFSRMNVALVPVHTVWCDNAFDTQRRRGDAPTLRSTFSFAA